MRRTVMKSSDCAIRPSICPSSDASGMPNSRCMERSGMAASFSPSFTTMTGVPSVSAFRNSGSPNEVKTRCVRVQ